MSNSKAKPFLACFFLIVSISSSFKPDEMLPSVRDYDAAVYMKWQGQSLQMGGYEYNPIIINNGDELLPKR